MKALAAACLASVLAAACSSPASEPLAGRPALDAEARHGERVFMRHCHACHPGGEAGLAPGLADKPLPRALMRLQVRTGVGAMPAFSEEELSSRDLDALLDYVAALRRHRGGASG
jgi:mono/diheme cytochrome c family protein